MKGSNSKPGKALEVQAHFYFIFILSSTSAFNVLLCVYFKKKVYHQFLNLSLTRDFWSVNVILYKLHMILKGCYNLVSEQHDSLTICLTILKSIFKERCFLNFWRSWQFKYNLCSSLISYFYYLLDNIVVNILFLFSLLRNYT